MKRPARRRGGLSKDHSSGGEWSSGMLYKSTRNSGCKVTSAAAITQGISADGGLFVPESLPALSPADMTRLAGLGYADRAYDVFSRFLTDFTPEEIRHCVDSAYNDRNFESDRIAELVHLYDGTYMLELWHGPTCAFKDMALQILPHLLMASAKRTVPGKEIVILVATSGDTGKAALEGFKDVPGTRILVFYPEDGVSPMQKRQMTTQDGANVAVCAIKGNFDDAQTGVKRIFTDSALAARLADADMLFSSANSINWGRLAPQIVYYISTYAELVKNGEVRQGDPINVVVPTGNFGNILAAYYAKHMGVPIAKLICASNANNVLTDFIRTGVYDRNRSFYTTVSPSMDILISSNLERLLYALCGEDDARIADWFGSLSKTGRYEVTDDVKAKLAAEFYGGFCDDDQTKAAIRAMFDKYSYLCDTHTAVAVKVYEDYRRETGDTTKTVIVSTASPYKFGASVLEAIGGSVSGDEYEMLDTLNSRSGLPVPEALAGLKTKPVRFAQSVEKQQMQDVVLHLLGL